MNRFTRLLLAPLFALTVLAAGAQPRGSADTFEATYSLSSHGSLERGARVGDVAVQRYGLDFTSGTALAEHTRLIYGINYSDTQLDLDAGVPLPAHLRSLALKLGVSRPLSPEWSALLMLQPGYFSEASGLDGDSFTIPVLLAFNYRASPGLVWTVGARYDAFSRNSLLPAAGVRWEYAPGWTLNVGFPKTGVTWKAAPDLTLGADISFQGGNYRVTRQPGQASIAIYPGLRDTYLDYREIRAGLTLQYELEGNFTLEVSGGFVADRRFDYFQRGVRLDGDTACYITLGLTARL